MHQLFFVTNNMAGEYSYELNDARHGYVFPRAARKLSHENENGQAAADSLGPGEWWELILPL
jgi:hypothetical protein